MEGQEGIVGESEADRVMREQEKMLKKKKPKVVKEESKSYDSADREMKKFQQKTQD